MKKKNYLFASILLIGAMGWGQPLSQRSPESIIGVFGMAIHMDCSKFKAPICDYEEGVKYNQDGTFEWLIAKDKKLTSKEIGIYEFKNDTVFHTQVLNYDYANANCRDETDCKEVEKIKEKGELTNFRFKKVSEPFTSVVKIQGDGSYQMTIVGQKTVAYRKIQ